jgi:hypothetical protein
LYAGEVGSVPFQVIERYGGETYPTFQLLNGRTGTDEGIGTDLPLFAPDSTHFVVDAPGWDNCAEGDGASLAVWRLTDSVPIREWGVYPWTCRGTGWGATDLRWRSTDTLEFVRNGVTQHGPTGTRQPMLVIHDAAGWRIVIPP